MDAFFHKNFICYIRRNRKASKNHDKDYLYMATAQSVDNFLLSVDLFAGSAEEASEKIKERIDWLTQETEYLGG